MTDELRSRLAPSVVVLGSVFDGKPTIVAMVTPGVKVNASDVVRAIAPTIGGSGGGRPEMAQAGGRFAEKLPEALKEVAPLVHRQLTD